MLNVMDAQRVRKWNCIMDQALAQGCGEHRLLLLRVMFVIGGRVLNPTHEATPRSGWHPSPLAIGISCTRLASCIAQVRASASRNTVLYGKPYTWYCSKFIFSYITCIYDNILNIHTKGFLVCCDGWAYPGWAGMDRWAASGMEGGRRVHTRKACAKAFGELVGELAPMRVQLARIGRCMSVVTQE